MLREAVNPAGRLDMMTAFAGRLAREVAPRPLARFAYNFGFKGLGAVRAFERRRRLGENFPAFLFISVTEQCNLRCQGCWVSPGASRRALDMPTLHRLVDQAAAEGVATFGILGGEPLLHEGLFELFEKHPDRYFLLFTNGTLLTDDVAAALRKTANVSPLISIEGREEVSDERRGGCGVYKQTLAGLDACSRHGLVTGVATSVCRSNFDDLVNADFVNEAAARGAHYLWYYIYRPVGPNPSPELALDEEQVLALRRFMVEIRATAPLLVVDSYWDHEGRALCPAAVGIGYHVGPGGDLEPCPPIQFACDNAADHQDLSRLIKDSTFLAQFRKVATATTRGCLLMDDPKALLRAVQTTQARDSSGRGTAHAELAAMTVRPSHHLPGREIPEKTWAYRFAKKHWFFGFGAYG